MPQLLQIGDKGYTYGVGVATKSLTPLYDRAAIVTRVSVTKPSADDNWIFSTTGQELARFPVNTVGNQQMLGGASSGFPKNRDIFTYCSQELGIELTYPVPQGQTFTVASAGGATADIVIEYEEHTPGDIQNGALNAPRSQHFMLPIFLVPNASNTGTPPLEADFASQITASWLPNLFGTVQVPAAYRIAILALFLEAAGRNTYSGSADHQSVTDHLALTYNGQRMFTRDGTGGIPMVGTASAAGSANSVYNYDACLYPAFQYVVEPQLSELESPFVLSPGSQAHFTLGLTGDVTGGATYAKALQCLLCDVQLTGMAPV